MDNNESSSSSASNTTKGDASSELVDGNETDSGNTGIELSSGGYSYELVDSLVKDMKELECPICCLLMRDALELSCHHAMCSSCLDKWGKENIEKKTFFTCPQCCVEIANEKIVPNGIINRLITTSIKVKCDNFGKGCEWIGVICDIVLHMKNKCDFTVIKCFNERCTEKVSRNMMDDHVAGCLYRIINCILCSCEVTFADQNEHFSGCEIAPVQCGNKGCFVTLPRNQITSHVPECHFKPIKCQFESIGCNIELSRKDMDEHLIHSTNYHMNLMLLETKTVKANFNETKTKLNDTKVELENVKMENDKQRKLLESNLELRTTKAELKKIKAELEKVRMGNSQQRKHLERKLEIKATKSELKENKAALENMKIENDLLRKFSENIFINGIHILIKRSQYFLDIEKHVIDMEKLFIAVNDEVKDRIRKFDTELKLMYECYLQELNKLNNSSINSHNNKIQNVGHSDDCYIFVLNEVKDIFHKYRVPFTAVEEKLVKEKTSNYYRKLTERLNKCFITDWKETTYSERIAAIMEYIPENSMMMHGDTVFLKLRFSDFDSSWELIIRKSEYFNPNACRIDVDKKTVEIELPKIFYSAGVCEIFQRLCLKLKFQRKTKIEQYFKFNNFDYLALYLSNGFILIEYFDENWLG